MDKEEQDYQRFKKYKKIKNFLESFFVSATLVIIFFLLGFKIVQAKYPSLSTPQVSNKLKLVSDVLQSVAQNLVENPIQDIYTTKDICGQGYQQIDLGYWSGTYQGCKCNNNNNNIEIGKCSAADIKQQCKTIPELQQYALQYWYDYKLCVQRVPITPYINNQCPSSYIYCSSSQLCVESKYKCPITWLDTQNIQQQATTDKLQISDTKKLVFSNSKVGQPLVNFKISIDGKPCIDNNQEPPRQVQQLFQLLKKGTKSGCTYGQYENNLQFIDSQSEKQLYQQNNILGLFEVNIQQYVNNIQGTASLYGLPRLEIKQIQKCQEVREYKFGDIHQTIIRLENTLKVYIYFSLIFTGILAVIYIYFNFNFYKNYKVEIQHKRIFTLDRGLLAIFIMTLFCLLSLITYIRLYYLNYLVEQARTQAKEMQELQCFDPNVSNIIKDLKSLDQNVTFQGPIQKFVLLAIIDLSLLLLMIAVYFFRKYVYKTINTLETVEGQGLRQTLAQKNVNIAITQIGIL